MNENLNLVEILKDCPMGTKLYTTICGEVKLKIVENDLYPIGVENSRGDRFWLTQDGRYISGFDGECVLFPSKEMRDWSKFKVKKPKFDPKTLQPFDKVLVRDAEGELWRCAFYSHKRESDDKYATTNYWGFRCCIPYNDDTKHLVATTKEAPEFYRHWED